MNKQYPESKSTSSRRSDGGPIWSVMIPTFNCANYLKETLNSVLKQKLGPELMQIEVVDDCSTKDDPEHVVREIGKGRVQFFRQPSNVGPICNFNTCVERSKGALVHILHGDDFVLPGFYEAFFEAFENNPNVGIVASRAFHVDPDSQKGYVTPRLEGLEKPTKNASPVLINNPLATPGVVVRRKCYEKVGGFRTDLSHVADWEMWVRLITYQGGMVLNNPLAAYRVFHENHTKLVKRRADNVREHLLIADQWDSLGYHQAANDVRSRAPEMALRQAEIFLVAGDYKSAVANRRAYSECLSKRSRFTRISDALREAKTLRSYRSTSLTLRLLLRQLSVGIYKRPVRFRSDN